MSIGIAADKLAEQCEGKPWFVGTGVVTGMLYLYASAPEEALKFLKGICVIDNYLIMIMKMERPSVTTL